MSPTKKHLEAFEVRQIAVEAMVDPRTVERVLGGRPVRPSTRARVEQALAAHGAGVR